MYGGQPASRRSHLPANQRTDGICATGHDGKESVVLCVFFQGDFISQDDKNDATQSCRRQPLQCAAQQQHAPRLRSGTEHTPNHCEEQGRLQRNVATKDVCELAVEGNEGCRSEGIGGDYPVELVELVCKVCSVNAVAAKATNSRDEKDTMVLMLPAMWIGHFTYGNGTR